MTMTSGVRRSPLEVGGAVLAAVLLCHAHAPQAQIRSGIETVSIFPTVRDQQGRFVMDLQAHDFVVLDRGTRVELTVFENVVQPITVAVLLDMSLSMAPRFLRVRTAAEHFIDALAERDRARLGTFGSEVALSPLLTNDRRDLLRVLHGELWPVGLATPLWQALDTAMTSLQSETGRRVLLVLTDGLDTGSLRGASIRPEDVQARAEREQFMIFAILLKGRFGMDPAIARLADETGGGHITLGDKDDLAGTFLQIADELRHQYLLGFAPTKSDGRRHRIQVQVQRADLRVRARRSYIAGRQ
jgi:Ca-activated chloride channel homolog